MIAVARQRRAAARPALSPAAVASPFYRRRGLIAVWLAAVVAFGGLTAYSRTAAAPLADPDPAYQRPGFLDVIPAYPAPSLGAGVPVSKARSVVFFTRPELARDLLTSIAADAGLLSAARMVVVVCGSGGGAAAAARSITVVDQEAGCPAAGLYKMRRPRDNGPPVGYAIVSPGNMVRYSTLDPEVTSLLDEVEHMTRGVS